ncbi:MAG: DUF5357 family protein [Elainellaceae cyanobacterium]
MLKIPTTADMMKRTASAVNTSRQHLWQTIRPNQAFSWQTLMFLCLFSWLMALLTSDSPLFQPETPISEVGRLSLQGSPAKYALFTMGWLFLTGAIAWLLSGSRWKIPLFDLVLRPAAWVAAAIPCIFAFQVWYDDNFEAALTFWPILAAIFYLFPRCVSLKSGYKAPKASERQHLLIIVLISLLLSCWIQFYFLVQDWVSGYTSVFEPLVPGLETEANPGSANPGGEIDTITNPDGASSADGATPTNSRPADIAEAVIASQLEGLSVPEGRQRLQTDPSLIQALNAQFTAALTNAQENPGWTIEISQIVPSPLSFRLQVVPPFTGTGAEGTDGATAAVYRICRVSPVENPGAAQLSQLSCQASSPQ